MTNSQYNTWLKLLRDIPVSVNNYYGDPLLQWKDTEEKLANLLSTKHSGPVGIITKGRFSKTQLATIKYLRDAGLRIVVLVSISELQQFEKVPMLHRYENISLLNDYGIPNIAYVRPLTPPYNTSPEVISRIFSRLKEVGAKAAVVAGFRGDDALVKDMNPDQAIEWALRVKVMPSGVYELVKEESEKNGIQLFTRTSCAVSWLCNQKTTFNPYYFSPNLVHCDELSCPIKSTCGKPQGPKPGSLELLRLLGYDFEVEDPDATSTCQIDGEKRLKCLSCCTTCFFLKVNRIHIKGNVSLGDLSFVRFLTGMLCSQTNVRDNGDKDIARVTFPKFPHIGGLQCLNTWFPYAHVGDRCFECAYCIEKYYGTHRREFGMPPAQILEMTVEPMKYQKGENYESASCN